MTKYVSLFLLVIAMSCGEKTADTTTQAATEPATSTPVATTTSATPGDQAPATSSTSQETQPAPPSSQQPAAELVVPGQKSSLKATYWKLIELNGKNIEGKTTKEMYLTLDPASPQFKSHSGCNLVMGEAKTSGSNKMWFINLLPTTMPCNTPEIDTEFQKALEETAEYAITGNVLVLNKKGAVPVLKFRAKG